MNICDIVANVNDKEDFIKFVGDLIIDLRNNPGSWENNNLNSYLEAMKSWVEDMDGWEKNSKMNVSEISAWNLMAHILCASTMYE